MHCAVAETNEPHVIAGSLFRTGKFIPEKTAHALGKRPNSVPERPKIVTKPAVLGGSSDKLSSNINYWDQLAGRAG